MKSTQNKKQDLILITAKKLFWKHGFRRVSIKEICEMAGVSKMTFYKFYPNKIELAKSIYKTLANESIEKFHTIIHDVTPVEDKIKRMLLLKLEGSQDISQEFLQDFYSENDLGLHDFVKTITQEGWKSIMEDFTYAQDHGWFRKDLNPSLFLIITQKISDLVNDPQLTQLYENPQELIMAITEFFIYGLVPRNP